jgi:hypothetical protein
MVVVIFHKTVSLTLSSLSKSINIRLREKDFQPKKRTILIGRTGMIVPGAADRPFGQQKRRKKSPSLRWAKTTHSNSLFHSGDFHAYKSMC